jgi:hypothetical protein
MGTSFVIAGRSFRRRSIIRLSADERAALERTGTVVLARPVEWPLSERTPLMDRAHVDPGGTDIWGTGPYLKVPNVGPTMKARSSTACSAHGGYPPDPLRASGEPPAFDWSTSRSFALPTRRGSGG